MAGVTYQLELDGIEAVQAKLNELLARGQNLQPAMADIGEMLLLSHDERWRDQVAPDGTPWAPLSQDYKARKKKNQDTILVLNDILRSHLNYDAGPASLEFGTPSEYGAIHHFGGSEDMRPQNAAIPARPWLGTSQDDLDQIYDILGDFLMGS